MNSARTLADRFQTQRTDRIRVDGVEVVSMTEISIAPDAAVEVVVEQARPDVEQSLHVRAKKAEIQVVDHLAEEDEDYEFDANVVSGSVTLVADQRRRIEFVIPHRDEASVDTVEISSPALPVTLQVWNSWLIGDAEHAWTGNSGMVVEQLETPENTSARMRLWCSDGLGDPQFDDLVVIITVGEPAT